MGLNKRLIDQVGGGGGPVPSENFDVLLYNGSSSAQTLSTSFKPSIMWFHQRNGSEQPIAKFPPVLGNNGYVGLSYPYSNNNNVTATPGTNNIYLPSHPFTNTANRTHAMWYWNTGGSTVTDTSGTISSTVEANTSAGISVVKYVGNGSSGATIGHGLGATPAVIFIKNASQSVNFVVFHQDLGNTNYLQLNSAAAKVSSSAVWNNTDPTSSVFSVGTDSKVNTSGNTYVAMCFAEVEGFSSFGSYTGNGSVNGPTLTTGFQPRFVMIKKHDGAYSNANWYIWDYARGGYSNNSTIININTTGTEDTGTYNINMNSDNFKLDNSPWAQINDNGAGFVYFAFA